MTISTHDIDLDYLASLDIRLDVHDSGTFKARPVRYLPGQRLFQVGDDDFDRWANSVERSFNLSKRADQRALVRWVKDDQ